MGHGAVSSQVEIPPVALRIEPLFLHPQFEHVETLFALAAADNFAHARDQHIHRAHRFFVVVDPHVKRLDRRG